MKYYIILVFIAVALCGRLAAVDAEARVNPRPFNRQFKEMAKRMKLDKPAEFVKGYAPKYPPGLAYQNKSGGAVILFTIDVDGKAKNFEVTKSSDERISNEIVRAMERWTFKPAEKNGEPISLRIGLPIDFALF